MTETATDQTQTEREALRRKLAHQAAGHEKAQAEVKAATSKIKAADEKAKADALVAKELRKTLETERNKAISRASTSAFAMEQLRLQFVPREIRQALGAAGREERAAEQRARTAREELNSASQSVAELKHRVKTTPSEASSVELLATIRRAQDALVPAESILAGALEGLAEAKARHASARETFGAAMRAALDL